MPSKLPNRMYSASLQNFTNVKLIDSFLRARSLFEQVPFPTWKHPEFEFRLIKNDDLRYWCNYLQSAELASIISWQVKSANDLLSFVSGEDWRHAQQQFKFAISSRSDDKFIGSIGFHSISQTHRTAEIAYDLSPEYWGKGIMASACAAFCNWGLHEVKLQRIQATVIDTNLPSLRVLERNGFNKEGLLRNFRSVRGAARDYWMLSKLPNNQVK